MFAIAATAITVGVALVLYLVFRNCQPECDLDDFPTQFQVQQCEKAVAGAICSFEVFQCVGECPLGFELDFFGCSMTCDCAKTGTYQSDIDFNPNTIDSVLATYLREEDVAFDVTSSSVDIQQRIWDENVVNGRVRVPYVMAKDFVSSKEAVTALEEAREIFSRVTCIDLQPRRSEMDFLEFVGRTRRCSSFVGRIGGRQTISVGSTRCQKPGNVQHEIMHALGFWHEHSRPDRDDHVRVIYENILQGYRHNFKKLSANRVRNLNSPYDGSSLMHFGGYTFSKDESSPTLVNKTTNNPMVPQRKELTKDDIAEINALYLCPPSNMQTTTPHPGDHWGNWSEWHPCSSSCDVGQIARLRDCLDAEGLVVYHGRCEGPFHELKKCVRGPCDEGSWGEWSSCSVTCGRGARIRESCCYPNNQYEQSNCTMPTCDYSQNLGSWLSWQSWDLCSRSCGGGWRRRYRDCVDTANNIISVRNCPWRLPGAAEFQQCSSGPCNDTGSDWGFWSDWGSWSACSETCGTGFQVRTRPCLYGVAGKGNCVGAKDDLQICDWSTPCPDDGGYYPTSWAPWSSWSLCSANCGEGMQQRQRTCYNYGSGIFVISNACRGRSFGLTIEEQNQTCTIKACASGRTVVQGRSNRPGLVTHWRKWSPWGSCSKTCNLGKRWRERDCVVGKFGSCEGMPYEVESCNLRLCGKSSGYRWNQWTIWSPCSSWCYGTRWRRRFFECVPPNSCASLPYFTVERCNMNCTINPDIKGKSFRGSDGWGLPHKYETMWSDWSSWSICSKSCGDGVKWRRRDCLFGKVGDEGCDDSSSYEVEPCNSHSCPRQSLFQWSQWSEWSQCSATCLGKRWRKRQFGCVYKTVCTSQPSVAVQPCNTACARSRDVGRNELLPYSYHDEVGVAVVYAAKWSTWSSWSSCNKPCGGGVKWRKRKCLFGNVGHKGCEDNSYAVESCNKQHCPSYWNQTTIFCDKPLQILDFNGDGLSDLLCVHDHNILFRGADRTKRNVMTVAINNGDGTFHTKTIKYESELFKVKCVDVLIKPLEGRLASMGDTKMDVIFQREFVKSEESGSYPTNLYLLYHQAKAHRRANQGLCSLDDQTSEIERQMVSLLDGGVHVFCYDRNGLLTKVFMNVTKNEKWNEM